MYIKTSTSLTLVEGEDVDGSLGFPPPADVGLARRRWLPSSLLRALSLCSTSVAVSASESHVEHSSVAVSPSESHAEHSSVPASASESRDEHSSVAVCASESHSERSSVPEVC